MKGRSMQRTLLCLSAAFSLTLAACGDDDGGASTAPIDDPNTVMQGQATGEQSKALTEISAGTDQAGAQGQISLVGQSIQAFASQHQAYKAMQQTAGLRAEPAALMEITRGQAAESFTYEDGHLSASVTYSSGQAAVLYMIDLQIDETDPGYTIDGTFNMEFSSSQGMYDVAYAYDAAYNTLSFDGAGCPVGGSIQVKYAFSVSGDFINNLPPEARAQIEDQVAGNGQVTASFGPACGDVVVEGT